MSNQSKLHILSLSQLTRRNIRYVSLTENAMCFVRSWMARAHNSWLVQRGCYLPSKNDALPHSMSLPTRAMTCKHERYLTFFTLSNPGSYRVLNGFTETVSIINDYLCITVEDSGADR